MNKQQIAQKVEKLDIIIKKPLLFKISSEQGNLQADLDCVERLQILLPREQFEDICGVCSDTWSNITFTQEQDLVLLGCKHMICAVDYDYNKLNGRCHMCRQEIQISFNLTFKDFTDDNSAFILNITSFKRYNLDLWRSIKCSQYGCENSAIFTCSICLDRNSAFCSQCVEDKSWCAYAKNNFMKALFYCGCNYALRLVQIQENDQNKLEKLQALNHADPKKYGYLLTEHLREVLIEQKQKQNVVFCYYCPNSHFNQLWELNRHIKDAHRELYNINNLNAIKCQECGKQYANKGTFDRHKCLALQF